MRRGSCTLAAGLSLTALPAFADAIRCDMADGATLAFDIDRTQFAPAVHANEPPRQQRTTVRYGDKQFPATPFFLGDARGFEADGLGGTTMLFVLQVNGTARLTNARAGLEIDGTCRVTEREQ